MALGVFSLLCNRCHQSPELYSSRKTETLHPLNNNSPFLPPLITVILLSFSMNLTTLVTSEKWNHVFVLLCWLVSLRMSLNFIHVVASIRISFLFKFLGVKNIPFYVYTIFCLSKNIYVHMHLCTQAKNFLQIHTKEQKGLVIKNKKIWLY